MPDVQEIRGDLTLAAYFAGQATAGTPIEQPLFRCPVRMVITAVEFIPNTAYTGDNTNYFTLNIRNRGQLAAGTAIPAALAFVTGVDGVALTPKALTISGTAAALACAANDNITAQKAVTASGLACPPGIVVVHYRGA